MTRLTAVALAFALTVAPLAAPAQQTGTAEDGFNLIEEGAKLLLRGLQSEMQPLMEDLAIEMEPKLREFSQQLLPMLEEFSSLIGDLDQYHPPEKLPNGDIILRRKSPDEVPAPEEGGDIDI